jgi:hypothetical protein
MVCLEMVLVHQPVLPERLVPMLVEVPALEPQVLYQAQPRSSVHCAKNGLRIHILSSVPPSLITSSASPALGIVLRGRGLGPRWVVLVDIWQYCLRGVYGTDSICAKWFSNIFVVILYIKKIHRKTHLSFQYIIICTVLPQVITFFFPFCCRFIVQVERSALWQTRMFLGHLCKVKLQPFWVKNSKLRRSGRLKPRREKPRYMGHLFPTSLLYM